MRTLVWKGGRRPATTIALVATDAALTKAQAKRLAVAAHGGLAKALRFAHAPLRRRHGLRGRDGPQADARRGLADFIEIAALAADCLARAVARGVYEATALPYLDLAGLERPFRTPLTRRHGSLANGPRLFNDPRRSRRPARF